MGSNSKQRLRPWLMGKLDSQTIPGLEWLPNEGGHVDRKKFKIPWKHGGKHDWSPEMGQVFKEWAEQTGKYRHGVDKEDYAKWKTNLRCAMNKSNDMQEIKEESCLEGESPFKVYTFLERTDKNTGSHIHKTEYSRVDLSQTRTCNLPHLARLPCHIAEYSSGSSMATSGSSRGANSGFSLASQLASNQGCISTNQNGTDSLTELMDMKSASLKEFEGALSSLDREELVKKEGLGSFDMDVSCAPCQTGAPIDDSSKMPPLMPLCIVKNSAENTQDDELDLNDDFTEQIIDIARTNYALPVASGAVMVTAANSPALNAPSPGSTSSTANLSQTTYVYSPGSNASPMPSPAQQYIATSQPSPVQQFSAASQLSPAQQYGTLQNSPQKCNALSQPTAAHQMSPQYFDTSSQPSPAQQYSPEQYSPEQFDASSQLSPAQQYSPEIFQQPDITEPTEMSLDSDPFHLNAASTIETKADDATESSSAPVKTINPLLISLLSRGPVEIGHQCPYATENTAMMVTILYNNKPVMERHITRPEGCCIAFKPVNREHMQILDGANLTNIKNAVYDHQDERETMALPSWPPSGNAIVDREVGNLLDNTSRGIVVTCVNGTIYVKRLCKTSIYFASQYDDCKKIARHDPNNFVQTVFDHDEEFVPNLEQFQRMNQVTFMADQDEVKYPNPEVCLFIGQNGTPENAHTRYIVVKITSCKAQKALKMVESQLYKSLEPEISKSTDLDNLDRAFKNACLLEGQSTEIN